MADRPARRLPGLRFQAVPPSPREVLPRMDIAVFVGFAAMGPIDVPVAIEDGAEFDAIFGANATLAWDAGRGEPAQAHLGPAVRAFFRNGGTRCWVIRVAGRAHTNRFPIPGLLCMTDRDGHPRLAPALARARSAGSWSDGLRVGAALIRQPLEIGRVGTDEETLALDVAAGESNAIRAGDLLRLQIGDDLLAMLPVARVEPYRDASPPTNRAWSRVAGRPVWFRTRPPASLSSVPGAIAARVHTWLQSGGTDDGDVDRSPVPVTNPPGEWQTGSDQITLDLRVALERAPEPGAFVTIDLSPEPLWLAVREVGVLETGDAPEGHVVRVSGAGFWWLQTPPASLPGPVRACERLTFDLRVRESETRALGLGALGLTVDHPRCWNRLETDDESYARRGPAADSTQGRSGPAAEPGFPLAGDGLAGAIYLPLDVAGGADRTLGPLGVAITPLKRDGLDDFGPALFLDPGLIDAGTEALSSQAEHLRLESPRRPRGLHAALGIEEATLVAVPDAVHRGWSRADDREPEPPRPSASLARPAWWRFLPCDPARPICLAPEPAWGHFLACGTRVIPPPVLERLPSGAAATFTLSWSPLAGAAFVLEESSSPVFDDPVVLYRGALTTLTIYGRDRGDYYYRVRAVVDTESSDWSNGVGVRVSPPRDWEVIDVEAYSADGLLAVERALLRMAAARGDLLAVMALPEHYHEDEALAHLHELTSPDAASIPVRTTDPTPPISRPLGAGEGRAFSYGAVYHPWLISREAPQPVPLRRMPPDGAACGLMARRALARGAWVAPANDLLHGIVALTPSVAPARRLDLQTAQLNLIRQEPRGFVTLSADTLSREPDLLPINVRRLLSLLRRLALREGATYAFEPNDASLRRLVQRGFEGVLTRMFERGAFAGPTAAAAFQVVTDSTLNTSRSVEQGRFIVELRVAPSRPLTFLTIRLVQSGGRTLVTEGR